MIFNNKMEYQFNAFGHPNMLATHKTTLEFTKDENLSLKGDCIVGVNADFEPEKIKKFIKGCRNGRIKIIIQSEDKSITEIVEAELNPNFCDENEIVIRKADFSSGRTLAIRSNKAAFNLKRDLIVYLKAKKNKLVVTIKAKKQIDF